MSLQNKHKQQNQDGDTLQGELGWETKSHRSLGTQTGKSQAEVQLWPNLLRIDTSFLTRHSISSPAQLSLRVHFYAKAGIRDQRAHECDLSKSSKEGAMLSLQVQLYLPAKLPACHASLEPRRPSSAQTALG